MLTYPLSLVQATIWLGNQDDIEESYQLRAVNLQKSIISSFF
jgi:hypothetical protein